MRVEEGQEEETAGLAEEQENMPCCGRHLAVFSGPCIQWIQESQGTGMKVETHLGKIQRYGRPREARGNEEV